MKALFTIAALICLVAPARSEKPMELTAVDFVTKVYGVADPSLPAEAAADSCRRHFNMSPVSDSYGNWLDHEDGYAVAYYGMTPDVTAMARYSDNDTADDFGFFFLFPYEAPECRESANRSQVGFCRCMLQEMYDLGLPLGVDMNSDALFDVVGRYADNLIELRLVEESPADNSNAGRFILALRVEPGAFTSGSATMQQLEALAPYFPDSEMMAAD